MPGHHVVQLVLRAPITAGSRDWCLRHLGHAHGVVVLYCTSTYQKNPLVYEVFAMMEPAVLLGAKGYYAYAGVMTEAIERFFGIILEANDQAVLSDGRRLQIEWAIYPERVWEFHVVSLGWYCANYVGGTVDLYYQDILTLGTTRFHHIQCYDVPQLPDGLSDLDQWHRGWRVYLGTLERPEWSRPLARL